MRLVESLANILFKALFKNLSYTCRQACFTGKFTTIREAYFPYPHKEPITTLMRILMTLFPALFTNSDNLGFFKNLISLSCAFLFFKSNLLQTALFLPPCSSRKTESFWFALTPHPPPPKSPV